jgi:hypothetical protein
MYSEIKPSTPEKQELARRRLVQTLKDNPKLSMNGCWDKAKKENPQLFADLQAADWMADDDDEAEERERKENATHGSFQPSNQARIQTAMCKAWESPEGGLIIQGAFLNPL